MAQSSFFYYNPEQAADSRHNGLFSPHPSTLVSASQLQRFQQSVHPQDIMNKQHQQQAQISGRQSPLKSQIYAAPLPSQPLVPVPSRSLYQRPAMILTEGRHLSLDTECANAEGGVYPATPPLSISGSTINSPPMTSGAASTPIDPVFLAGNIEGVKEGCEVDVKSEILAGENWTRCGSPPLTPGKKFLARLHPHLHFTIIWVCGPQVVGCCLNSCCPPLPFLPQTQTSAGRTCLNPCQTFDGSLASRLTKAF